MREDFAVATPRIACATLSPSAVSASWLKKLVLL
jgi:hypothetical protein